MLNAALTAAMEAYKPEIAARYVQSMRNLFAAIVERHGSGRTFTKVYNCWTYAKALRNSGLGLLIRTGADGEHEINEVRMADAAAAYADEVVQAWAGKIEAKMGDLESATAHYVSGTAFQITGTRGGHKVAIDQHMIINVSSLGRPFNQWPSRIYVDGKFTSEAAYKKMFKAVAL